MVSSHLNLMDEVNGEEEPQSQGPLWAGHRPEELPQWEVEGAGTEDGAGRAEGGDICKRETSPHIYSGTR